MAAPDRISGIRARESPRAESDGAPATVLVVDDRSINREFLGYVLASCGHALDFAGDGNEALASVRRRRPDLIITDVAMPGMGGLELAAKLRADRATADIPVIFYTATYGLEQTRELARACGVALVLPKPSEPEVIMAEVAKILSQRSTATALRRVVPAGTEQAAFAGLQERLHHTFAETSDVAAERTAAPTTSGVYRLSLRLAAVLELALNLSAERNPRHLLELLCRAARDIVGVRATGVVLLAAAESAVWFVGEDDAHAEPRSIDPNLPFVADVVRHGVPVHLARGDARLAAIPAAFAPETVLLAVPVLSPAGALGVLYFADKAGEASFGPHDELFATTLAALLGTYYDNLRLLTEVQRNAVELAANANRYRLLFESSPVPMWVYDLDTLAFLAVNDAAVEHYGYSHQQFVAMSIEDIRPTEDIDALHDSLGVNSGGLDHSGIWRHRRRDGSTISVSITSHTIDFSGRRAKLVLALDVSERLAQERKIARLSRVRAVTGAINSAMLRLNERDALLEEACRIATTEGVFPVAFACEFDADSENLRIVAFRGKDASVRTITERAAADATSRRDLPHFRAAKSGRPVILDDLGAAASPDARRTPAWPVSYRSCAAFPLFTAARVVAVLVFLAEDRGYFDADELALLNRLTADLSFALEHIEQSARLAHLAYYDALTGLPNMRLFADRLEQILHVARQDGAKVCVLALDLERFTRVNDTLGRDVGDELLRQVSVRLGDFLVEPYTLGRVGADTFAVASPRDADAIARRLRERITDALRLPFVVAGQEVAVTAQSGIALFPADGDDPFSLFKNAEAALRQAKADGRPYAYYSSEISDRIQRRLDLEEQLRAAIDAEQFVLHYQPRVDMTSGAVIGAEALIRWQHPSRGLVAPGEFIALAEETGLIVPIGAWAIDRVCAQLAAWSRAGVDVVPVAVNLSSAQFETGDLFDVVHGALKRHALAPALLELELTESAVMKDSVAAAGTLKTLRSLGVGLALDDFGTGHSSLAHLKRFPFAAVKIDRTFITDLTQNTEDAAIAAAIIAMAHRMELRVVAEGVETQGQFNYLRLHDCDEMQGFLFSPAVAAEVFVANLAGGWPLSLPAADPVDQRTLLVVDDEEGIRNALRRTLRRDGYRILTAASADEALELLALHRVQVIISDQRMPGISGTEFLGIASRLYPDTVRIILSGYTDLAVVTESVNRGAVFKFLTKPWDDGLLREQVRDAFRRYRPEPGPR